MKAISTIIKNAWRFIRKWAGCSILRFTGKTTSADTDTVTSPVIIPTPEPTEFYGRGRNGVSLTVAFGCAYLGGDEYRVCGSVYFGGKDDFDDLPRADITWTDSAGFTGVMRNCPAGGTSGPLKGGPLVKVKVDLVYVPPFFNVNFIEKTAINTKYNFYKNDAPL
jgi:hypothetical protein